jgi:hypothetical protein
MGKRRFPAWNNVCFITGRLRMVLCAYGGTIVLAFGRAVLYFLRCFDFCALRKNRSTKSVSTLLPQAHRAERGESQPRIAKCLAAAGACRTAAGE